MDNLIKFVSYDRSAEQFFPPLPMSKVVPQWYKDTDLECEHRATDQVVPTIRKCVPVRDYLTCGYVIRNPYEVDIKYEPDEEGIVGVSSVCPVDEYISQHPWKQAPTIMQGIKNHYFKVANVWKVITPPGYSCHFYQPFFHLQEDYRMFPAIVDTDTHDDAVNFVGVGIKHQFKIPAGAPLMVVYPFKRQDWKMETEYKDYSRQNSFKFFIKKAWHGNYAKLFHSRKKFR